MTQQSGLKVRWWEEQKRLSEERKDILKPVSVLKPTTSCGCKLVLKFSLQSSVQRYCLFSTVYHNVTKRPVFYLLLLFSAKQLTLLLKPLVVLYDILLALHGPSTRVDYRSSNRSSIITLLLYAIT